MFNHSYIRGESKCLLNRHRRVPDEGDLANLDSSLKKNTTYIKRLKNITADHLESIAAEFTLLKLSKYIAEVTAALFDNKLKNSSDIFAFVERYAEFYAFFVEGLRKEVGAAEPVSAEERVAWLTRQRQLLRLVAELHLVGIIEDSGAVLKLLQRLLPEDDDKGPLHVPLATSFVKGVGAYFVTIEGGHDEQLVSAEWRTRFNDTLTNFFKAMSRLLVRTCSRLSTLESKGRKHYETRGDLSQTQTRQIQEVTETFEKLCTNLQTLAETLNLCLPDLAEVEATQFVEGKIVFADLSIKPGDKPSVIYDSEEERSFYEDIIDLRERVPEVLLPSVSIESLSAPDASLEDLNGVSNIDPDSVTEKKSNEVLSPEDHKGATIIAAFFEKLHSMQSRSLADQAAIDFCFINSKSMRNRLAETLVDLPHKRLDLLPFIGRLLATLKPHFPAIASAVYDSLVGQFVFLFHRPEPIIGTRSRVCRFIGELTKFRVMPQTRTYGMLKKTILEDLSGYNIEMTTFLLESCGRYLYNQPESHKRLENLFEIIQKKKNQGMEHYQMVMLSNAIYISNPPEHVPITKTEKPVRLKYLFKLMRVDLEPANSEHVFRQIKKFPWNEENCRSELMRAFLKVWKVKYSSIPSLAAMVGSISASYPSFVVDLVDRLLEEIRQSLEKNSSKLNQRLISGVKYIGELFCYNVIEADVIFATLYQLVTFGHPGVPRIIQPSPIDAPNYHFRIRLICILLSTCAAYLIEKELSAQFESFMILFEYYVATKTKVPMDIEYLLYDTYEELDRKRPANQLSEAILRLVKASNGTLSNLLDDPNVEPEMLTEEYEEEPFAYSRTNTTRDDDFEKALAGMMTSSLEERKLERRAGVFDAPIPLSLLYPTSPTQGPVAIKMLIKKKNKSMTKELAIDPAKVSFVQASLAGRDKEIKDQQRVKRLVLESQRADESPMRGLAPRRQGKNTFSTHGHRRTDS